MRPTLQTVAAIARHSYTALLYRIVQPADSWYPALISMHIGSYVRRQAAR
jgi:hypothetical protein